MSSSITLKKAIIFSGKICSGKSTIAKKVAKEFCLPIASFGDYLKNHCKKNGIPLERDNLQRIGNQFIEENPTGFLEDVIRFSNDHPNIMVFEGVRHEVIVSLIKSISEVTFSVYLDATTMERYRRFISRQGQIDSSISFKEFELQDNHVVEREVLRLGGFSDLNVNANGSVNSFWPRISSKIESFLKI